MPANYPSFNAIPNNPTSSWRSTWLEHGGIYQRYSAWWRYLSDSETYWRPFQYNYQYTSDSLPFLIDCLIKWYGQAYNPDAGCEMGIVDSTLPEASLSVKDALVWGNGPSFKQREAEITFTGEPKEMVNLKIKRENGKVYLYVDAKGLHETLDAVGAVSNSAGWYENRPQDQKNINLRSRTMGTEVFLKKEYPHKIDLSALQTEPLGFSNLKALSASSHEMVRRILEHYQPIDICVDIQKKIVK